MKRIVFVIIILCSACESSNTTKEPTVTDQPNVKPASDNVKTSKSDSAESTKTETQKSEPDSEPKKSRFDTRGMKEGAWRVSSLGNDKTPDDTPLSLSVAGPKFTFFGGCNTLTTMGSGPDTTIRFRDISQTEKACDAAVMATEKQLFEMIPKVDLLEVAHGGKVLVFRDKDLAILFVVAKKTPAP